MRHQQTHLNAQPLSYKLFASTLAIFLMTALSSGCGERSYQPAKWRPAPRASSDGTESQVARNESKGNPADAFPVTDWTNSGIGGNVRTGNFADGRGSSMSRRGSSMIRRGSTLSGRGSTMSGRGGRAGSNLPMRTRGNGSAAPGRRNVSPTDRNGSSAPSRFNNPRMQNQRRGSTTSSRNSFPQTVQPGLRGANNSPARLRTPTNSAAQNKSTPGQLTSSRSGETSAKPKPANPLREDR